MSRKFSHLSVFAAIFALCLMVASPAFAHHSESHTQGGSEKSTEDTKGNDRKSGYEDNSSEPQETNHGKGADNDGDADSDPNTADEDDHTTSDDGDNAHPSGKDRSVEKGGSGNQGRSESNPDDSKGPMRYEGVQGDDKSGGPGGTDLADQDGNNGCGNDDDFDDDNNGWCGKPTRVKGDTTPKTCPAGQSMNEDGSCDKVKGNIITKTKTCPNGETMPVNEACRTEAPSVPCDKDNNMANGIQACDDDAVVIPDVDTNPSNPDEDVLGTRIDKAAQPAGPSVLGVRLSPALSEPVAVAGAVLPFTGGELLVFLAAALALIAAGAVALKLRSNEA